MAASRNDQSFKDAINRAIEGSEESQSDSQDIRIDVVQEPEVKPEVWKDTESLIYKGFITLNGDINGVEFIFKSLNQHEFQFVTWLGGNGGNRAAIDRFYNTFLAYGVFMVDGVSVLSDRARWIPELAKFFSELQAPAKNKLIRYLSEVNRRASNAVTLTEAYIMEQSSRFRWAQLQGLDLMSPTCTGVDGTHTLGLNYGQLVWRALNHYEDTKESAEREWDNAKFVGSCFAGKEVQKVYNQDRERRRKEKEARVERRDKLLRQVLLGEDQDEGKDGKRMVKMVARTVEELASQLERDLRGEKDWHDQVVEAEQARMHAQIQERRDRINELVRERAAKEGEQEMQAFSTTAQGLTAEEVRYRIANKKQLEAQRNASKMIRPEMDPRLEVFLSKYHADDGTSHAPAREPVTQTDRDPTGALPVPPARQKVNPFRR